MAITPTHLFTAGTSTDGTSWTSGTTWLASANSLVLAAAAVSFSGAEPTLTLDGTAVGLTFENVLSAILFDTSVRKFAVFRAMGASPATGAPTLNATQTCTGFQLSIAQFTGVDTSGTNGSGAIVQAVGNNGNSGTIVTLAAFADAVNNMTYGAAAGSTNSAPTVGTGFTLLGSNNGASPGRNIISEYKAGEDTTVDAGMASIMAIVGIEIKMAAANVVPVKSRYYRMMGVQ
jgi:hypothetical protein